LLDRHVTANVYDFNPSKNTLRLAYKWDNIAGLYSCVVDIGVSKINPRNIAGIEIAFLAVSHSLLY
jgi:hypothetical protein